VGRKREKEISTTMDQKKKPRKTNGLTAGEGNRIINKRESKKTKAKKKILQILQDWFLRRSQGKGGEEGRKEGNKRTRKTDLYGDDLIQSKTKGWRARRRNWDKR